MNLDTEHQPVEFRVGLRELVGDRVWQLTNAGAVLGFLWSFSMVLHDDELGYLLGIHYVLGIALVILLVGLIWQALCEIAIDDVGIRLVRQGRTPTFAHADIVEVKYRPNMVSLHTASLVIAVPDVKRATDGKLVSRELVETWRRVSPGLCPENFDHGKKFTIDIFEPDGLFRAITMLCTAAFTFLMVVTLYFSAGGFFGIVTSLFVPIFVLTMDRLTATPLRGWWRAPSTVCLHADMVEIERTDTGTTLTIPVSEIRGVSVESGFVRIDLSNGNRIWFSTPGMPAWHFVESIQGAVGR